jgi:hypothetical protein
MAAVHGAGCELRAGGDRRVRTHRNSPGAPGPRGRPRSAAAGLNPALHTGDAQAVLRAHARGHASPRTGGKQRAQPLAKLAAIICARRRRRSR